jgi:dTDP-4-amino-4,6-dideoxygalactose transaminase
VIYIAKPFITDAEKTAVLEVLDSGMLAQGTRTAQLEDAFAEICGTKHAVATSSGTTALHLGLLANGIGEGDEVITSPFTFIASVNSILFVGARPVFADIEMSTFNIDPVSVEEKITSKTRAIMPVHLYGQMCKMDAIMAIADKHNLVVIEDAAQAIGATFNNKPAGCFGTAAFSLYATKNVMSGEGGMITTDDDRVAEHCRMLRNHGMKQRYYHDMLGYNFRTSDIHAAIGLAQISRLEEMTERRRKNAEFYNENLKTVITPQTLPEAEHVWHQYTVRFDGGRDRDKAAEQLKENGVGSGIFYPVPAHQQGYIRDIVGEVELPVAEQMANEVLSLPVHPQLTQEDREKIVYEVNRL